MGKKRKDIEPKARGFIKPSGLRLYARVGGWAVSEVWLDKWAESEGKGGV